MPDTVDTRRLGFAAGVVGALVMLVAMVALRIVSGATSLLEVIAEGMLQLMPGALFSTLLDSLQRAAKPLLFLGIVIGTLVVGGFLGRWYGAQPTRARVLKLIIGAWLVFGLGVYTLLGAGPFGSRLLAGPIWHAATLLGLFGVFGLTLVETTHVLATRAEAAQPDSGRRLLLRNAGIALVATIGVGGVWRLLAGSLETTQPVTPTAGAANPQPFDLAGLSPEVTPTADFYTVSKNFIDPAVNASGWRLKIDGLVDKPLELDYDQLRALPASEGYYTLMCISNEVGGPYWGNAYWRGVKLKYLLEQAGVHTDGFKAVFSAADDYRDSVRLERALHPDALLAWEMNGEPLAREHGFPARLLIPGIYGMKNVKWLTGITIVSSDFRGFWQQQGWDDAAPYQTASRIDVPRARQTIGAGPLDVAGVAFAGDRGIQMVELSADGGQNWQPAQVKPGLSPYTWQLWRASVQVDRGTRELRVRATDGQGHPQIREVNPPFPSGSTGYHTISVAVAT